MSLEPVRLVSYVLGAETSIGILDDEHIWDLPAAFDAATAGRPTGSGQPPFLPSQMRGFMALGDRGVDAALEAANQARARGRMEWRGRTIGVATSKAILLPPVPNPQKILCTGLIFATHAAATGQEVAKQPQIFMKPATALVGDGAAVVLPKAWPERVVPGTELCAVIGRGGRDIDEGQALNHCYGYTVLNDITARGLPFPKNKTFDGFCPVGPYLVPRAYAPDPQNVWLRIRVNGEEKESANTSDMIFPVARQIHDCAEVMTLAPGDYIATGDVGSEAWLRPGDVVEADVEGIGVLTSRFIAAPETL